MKRFDTDIKHLWKAAPIVLAILTAGCSSDIDVNAPDDSGAPLSFSVNVPSATRSLTYDGASTYFNDGARIGCVIATKSASDATDVFTYCANSCWTYVKDDNSLLLEKLFDSNNDEITEASNDILRHYNASDDLFLDYKYAIKLLKENTEYAFHFYYPYVDKDIYENVKSSYTYKYKDETGNEASDVIAPITAIEASSQGDLKYFDWKNFPTISHINFENNTNNSLLEANDFMFANVKGTDDNPITAANKSGTLKVSFEKKMATVDIIFTTSDAISNVKLILTPESGTETVARTYLFDMSTGTPAEGSISCLNDLANYPADADGKNTIIPKLIDGTKTYRLILPPQSAKVTFAVSFKAGDATYTLEGTTAITIEGNTRYVLNVSKAPTPEKDHIWQMDLKKGNLIDAWNNKDENDQELKQDIKI